MIKARKETLLGVKIPVDLRENVNEYCFREGIKIKAFVAQAIREKLAEIIEDKEDNVIVDERLEKPQYTEKSELKKYIHQRKA